MIIFYRVTSLNAGSPFRRKREQNFSLCRTKQLHCPRKKVSLSTHAQVDFILRNVELARSSTTPAYEIALQNYNQAKKSWAGIR